VKRFAFAAALAGALLAARAPAAWSCSCMSQTAPAMYASAGAVFTGDVTSVEASAREVIAVLQVRAVYKGSVVALQPVRTDANGAACGVEFVAGIRYTVFASVDGGAMRANLCGGTEQGEAVLARAGAKTTIPIAAGVEPAAAGAKSAGRATPIVIAGVLLAAAAAVLARARLRPRKRFRADG
jgi:hypothetical protein